MSNVRSSKSSPRKSKKSSSRKSKPSGSSGAEGPLPIIGPAHLPTRVRIDGDAAHDPRALALADDMTRLVRGYLERSASGGHKKVSEHERDASATHGDLKIRVRTVDLEPTAQRHLIEQIKMLVSKRFAKE